uniref:Uncharacterized protein n=1 Tax=Arundo donax TaxID=35708 RepID=A0A0A9EFT2_ARUDO
MLSLRTIREWICLRESLRTFPILLLSQRILFQFSSTLQWLHCI